MSDVLLQIDGKEVTAREGQTILYPVSETARARKAGVEAQTDSPADAYAPFPHWRLGRPDAWADLPWIVVP